MRPNKLLLPGITIFISILIGFAWLSQRVSDNARANAPDSFNWQISVIDTANDVGQFPSLSLKPGLDTPYISYYDKTLGDLKLAFPVSTGGDCGPENSWSCNSLAFQNSTNFGSETSLDFNSLGQWGIAYTNFTNVTNAFRGIPGPGAQEIFWENIEPQAGNSIVVLNSMGFDNNDVSHISYGFIDINNLTGHLKHAEYVGLGGNCGLGIWQCDIIVETSPASFAIYNALTFFQNIPVIAYRDINQNLSMAIFGGSGNCGPNNDWDCSVIEATTTIQGLVSIYGQNPDFLGIAYIGGDTLRFAKYVGNGMGNCGTGIYQEQFLCIILDSVGVANNAQLMGVSLGVSNSQPVIAYTDTNDRASTVMKIAYPQTDGNCGPLDTNLDHTWQCEVVDGGANTNDVGYYPSLKVGTDGLVQIAYYDYTAGNLKYAISDNPVNPTPAPTPSSTPTPPPAALTPRMYLPLITR